MLLKVDNLTDQQLYDIGLPPNPHGWNCFDTKSEQYCDAIFCNMFVREHYSAEQLEALGYYCSRSMGWVKPGTREDEVSINDGKPGKTYTMADIAKLDQRIKEIE
jgi:hypothetical protein